jgi:hypothetical protein
MALIFNTTSIQMGAAGASTTLTHGLGIAPNWVRVQSRTSTGGVMVLSSTSQIVLLAGLGVANVITDVEVQAYHSIIQ